MLDAVENDGGTMEIEFTTGGFTSIDANRVEFDGADLVFLGATGAVAARLPRTEVASIAVSPDDELDAPLIAAVAGPSKAYSVAEVRLTHPQAYAPWTEREERVLLALTGGGMTNKEIASVLGRQIGGVTSRLAKLRDADDEETAAVRFE